MNKLKTTMNGGMPLELDDIRWEQEAVREGFKAILDIIPVLDASGYIITGCLVTEQASSYLISAGYVYINGEIYKVDEHEVDFGAAGCHYVFEVEVTYDPAGEEMYEDGTIQQTYEVRKAKVIVNTEDPFIDSNYVQMGSNNWFAKIQEAILTNINANNTPWYSIGTSPAPSYVNGFTNVANEPVAYRKDAWGNVTMRGAMQNANPALAVAFTLPAGFCPDQKMSMAYDIGGTTMQVIINTNGEVQCSGGIGILNFVNYKPL